MNNNTPWWQRAVFCQIYPRSFMDSKGDGVGDLQGILDRLEYLVKLGVDAVWISPIFPSPMADFGYDVADYTGIDPIFGDMETFDRLLSEAHLGGLRISEVSYLQLNDVDLDERKLFIRNSKERKDRVAYMSDTAAMALQQHLAILGVIVGVINVTAEDTRGFLLAAIGLSVSATALNASPIVGTAFSHVLPFVVAFVAGATIVVSLRELFQTARS